MKKKLFIYSVALFTAAASFGSLHAQDTTTVGQDLKNAANKTGKAVKKGTQKAGNKTAEIASKGKSAVVDKVHDSKQGPNGEKIFIDGEAKFYYIDSKGHKQYVPASKLKDK